MTDGQHDVIRCAFEMRFGDAHRAFAVRRQVIAEHAAITELKQLDPDRSTPREALEILYKLKTTLG